MSHATNWTCRSCGSVLGHVRDGVLRPLVPVEQVDSRGVARFRCPRCGEVRAWFPSGGALTAKATSGVADTVGLPDSG